MIKKLSLNYSKQHHCSLEIEKNADEQQRVGVGGRLEENVKYWFTTC